jgi:hypothetical protein
VKSGCVSAGAKLQTPKLAARNGGVLLPVVLRQMPTMAGSCRSAESEHHVFATDFSSVENILSLYLKRIPITQSHIQEDYQPCLLVQRNSRTTKALLSSMLLNEEAMASFLLSAYVYFFVPEKFER